MTTRYYKNHKGKFRKEARERYQNLSEEKHVKTASIIMNVIKIFLLNKSKNKLSA